MQRILWIGDSVSISMPSFGILLRGTIKDLIKDCVVVKFIGGDEFIVNSNIITVEKENAGINKN
jgi:hypothetical protein